ncbi:MAG: protein kinase [Deltaproteobacteria bacterium]|nr:protein kinase [Deltaproteobacteria bacterium]
MGQPSQPLIDPLIGTTLGRYAIQARLGEGGMGTVYRAEQWPLGRPVALKVIHRSLIQDAKVASRFLREAKIACALTNPHTVTIYDFGQAEDGTLYLAMELLVGESLQQRLTEKGRIAPELAAEVAAQVCRSLVEAHRKGIVHRDLKPDNIFLGTSDDGSLLVKVLDYGLARIMTADDSRPSTLLTQIGTIVGTPIYMSPEQARGKPLDQRTDLYSMGVVLYEMLTGVPPFQDEDAVLVLGKHIREPVPLMESIGAKVAPPEALEILVHALLQKQPGDRPPDASHVYQALRDYLMMSGSRGASLPSMPSEEGSQPWTLARLARTADAKAESGILERLEPAPPAPEPDAEEPEIEEVDAAATDSSPTAAEPVQSVLLLESAPTSIIPLPTPAENLLPSETVTVTDDEPTNAATPLPSARSGFSGSTVVDSATPPPVQSPTLSLTARSPITAPRNVLVAIGTALAVLAVALVIVVRDSSPELSPEPPIRVLAHGPSLPLPVPERDRPALPLGVAPPEPAVPPAEGPGPQPTPAPRDELPEAPPGYELAAPPRGWTGTYTLTGGALDLEQHGTTVTGSFGRRGRRATLRGTVTGSVLTFSWRGPQSSGRGVLRSFVSGDRVTLRGTLGTGAATGGNLELTAERTAEAAPPPQSPRILKSRPAGSGPRQGLKLDTNDIFKQRRTRP